MSDYYIKHSAGPWKKHKYIRKEGDRYIYPGSENKQGKLVYGSANGRGVDPYTGRPVSAPKNLKRQKQIDKRVQKAMLGYGAKKVVDILSGGQAKNGRAVATVSKPIRSRFSKVVRSHKKKNRRYKYALLRN